MTTSTPWQPQLGIGHDHLEADPVVRSSGIDAVLAGKTVHVEPHGSDHVNLAGEGCGFNTSDQPLAKRGGLAGDFYNGWHGAAPLAELTEVDERVTSIHPRRRES